MSALSRLWDALQIGRHGQYSVERLQAFHHYDTTTPAWRVACVCIGTLLPSVLVVLAMDACFPLVDISLGWKANYMTYVRGFVTVFAVTTGMLMQASQFITQPPMLSVRTCVANAIAIVLFMGLLMLVSDLSGIFPLPFVQILSGLPISIFLGITFMLLHGSPAKLKAIPGFLTSLQGFNKLISAENALICVYPLVHSVYSSLESSKHQTVVILFLPLLKLAMKTLFAQTFRQLGEMVPEMVVFYVDLFNALYISACMQTANSMVTTVCIVVVDLSQILIAFRRLLHHTRQLQDLMTQIQSQDNQALVPTVLQLLDDPTKLHLSQTILRIRGDMKYPQLTTAQIRTLAALEAHATATGSPCGQEPTPSPRVGGHNPIKKTKIQPMAVTSSTEVSQNHTRLLQQTTKFLYHTEYLVLVEYMECAIPLLYALYIGILSYLPNRMFYPQMREMEASQQLQATIVSLIMYASMECLSFLAFYALLKWKFKMSIVRQLAFVLETQRVHIHGRLLMLVVFVLPFTLDHHGVDFTFRFPWFQYRNP